MPLNKETKLNQKLVPLLKKEKTKKETKKKKKKQNKTKTKKKKNKVQIDKLCRTLELKKTNF